MQDIFPGCQQIIQSQAQSTDPQSTSTPGLAATFAAMSPPALPMMSEAEGLIAPVISTPGLATAFAGMSPPALPAASAAEGSMASDAACATVSFISTPEPTAAFAAMSPPALPTASVAAEGLTVLTASDAASRAMTSVIPPESGSTTTSFADAGSSTELLAPSIDLDRRCSLASPAMVLYISIWSSIAVGMTSVTKSSAASATVLSIVVVLFSFSVSWSGRTSWWLSVAILLLLYIYIVYSIGCVCVFAQ
mmetsp:Transcript_15384/g.27501  ORF Transcript_15384/g.27501 Transcript_15384/m.27501 type:complete len:250 (-) Transcript_15384:42-791(-)